MNINQCLACGRDNFVTVHAVAAHVTQSHQLTSQEYYDKYLKGDKEGICINCDNETHYRGLTDGYYRQCRRCASRENAKQVSSYWSSEKGIIRKAELSEWMQGNTYLKGKHPSEETLEKMSNSAINKIKEIGCPVSYKGIYTPEHPEKYVGRVNNIVFRSLWERRVMQYLDTNSNILQWSSEEIFLPYLSPKDSRAHLYYPDFYVKAKKKDDSIVEMLWEVKPFHQTQPPSPTKGNKRKSPKRRHRYLVEAVTYGVNIAKWEAAKKFCADHGWEFKILTEKDIFGNLPHFPHK